MEQTFSCFIIFKTILFICVLVQIANTQSTSDCKTTYSCFLQPANCVDTACKFIYKWKSNSNNIDFALYANIGSSSSKWLGIGFSTDQSMGSDSVVVCKSTGEVQSYYNNGHNSGLVSSSSPTFGITSSSVNASTTWLICTFSRQVQNSQYSTYYDLNTNYYILAAYGGLSSSGDINEHDKTSYSGSKANFLSTTDVLSGSKMANMQTQYSFKFLFVIALMCQFSIYWIFIKN